MLCICVLFAPLVPSIVCFSPLCASAHCVLLPIVCLRLFCPTGRPFCFAPLNQLASVLVPLCLKRLVTFQALPLFFHRLTLLFPSLSRKKAHGCHSSSFILIAFLHPSAPPAAILKQLHTVKNHSPHKSRKRSHFGRLLKQP